MISIHIVEDNAVRKNERYICECFCKNGRYVNVSVFWKLCSMLSINITDALFVGIRVAVIAKKESITCFNCLIYNYYQINFNYINYTL